MSRPSKRTPEVHEMIVERLRSGSYANAPLPSTRKLGAEFGVSKFTILRAFRQAEEEGLLVTRGRTRVAVSESTGKKRALRLACVVPSVELSSSFQWFLSIDNVAINKNGSANLISYRGISDPRLTQALAGKFDVLFLNPPHGPLTPLVRRLLIEKRDRVVLLYEDMPELELWGIDNMPLGAIDLLIFHLASLGHREIHLVGCMPPVGRQKQLIDKWRTRLDSMGATGTSWFPDSENTFFQSTGRAMTLDLLAARPRPGAIIYADIHSASGGYRALWERGIKPGADVSITALTCEPEALLMTPSLTCLDVPSRETVIEDAVQSIMKSPKKARSDWADLVLPKVRLRQGESSIIVASE